MKTTVSLDCSKYETTPVNTFKPFYPSLNAWAQKVDICKRCLCVQQHSMYVPPEWSILSSLQSWNKPPTGTGSAVSGKGSGPGGWIVLLTGSLHRNECVSTLIFNLDRYYNLKQKIHCLKKVFKMYTMTQDGWIFHKLKISLSIFLMSVVTQYSRTPTSGCVLSLHL